MVGMSLPGWVLAGLVVFGILITLAADTLVLGRRRAARPGPSGLWLATWAVASLIWATMVFAAGVLAVRYAERIEPPWACLLAYAVGAVGLSVLRAKLFRRIGEEEVTRFWFGLVHALLYPLAALALFLLLAGLLRQHAEPWLLLPLLAGTLLPGLVGCLPWAKAHSLASLGIVGLGTALLIPILGWDGWAMIAVGYLAHLLVDLLRPAGIVALWPIRDQAIRLWGGLARHSRAERWMALVLVGLVALLLTKVPIGPAPPPTSPVLSFDQSVARYYSLRGRTLVFAQVWGSWQASGRPASGRFEVLNAEGSSLILLDRYDGTVFSAGRGAGDDFYIDSISLSTGSAVQIKAVEVHLEGQYLAEALPMLYAMQKGPGLEHIYVSGELLMGVEADSPLMPGLSRQRLRQVEVLAPGHYRLSYLTAVELRELAEIPVRTADLMVVATYRTPADGPTATPLPPMPTLVESQP